MHQIRGRYGRRHLPGWFITGACVAAQLLLVVFPGRAQQHAPAETHAAGVGPDAVEDTSTWITRGIRATAALRCMRADECGSDLATGRTVLSGPSPPTSVSPTLDDPPPAAGLLLVGGVVGGAIGVLAGTGISAGAAGDDIDIDNLIVGGPLGAGIGIPLGVHVANGERGNLLPSVGAATGIGLASASVAAAVALSDGDPTIVAVGLPLGAAAQLLTSIVIERNTAVDDGR